MTSEENLKKETMVSEAAARLTLMGADSQDIQMLQLNGRTDFKVVVDHKSRSVRKEQISDEELQMISKIEDEYGFAIYYTIKDEGVWPDGCTFERYTLPYVGKHEEDYRIEREDAIGRCGTCPAYVVNMEDDSCSEITEFVYRNIGGLLINAS